MTKEVILAQLIFLITASNVTSQNRHLDSINFSKIVFYRNTDTYSFIFFCKRLEQSNSICKKIEALTGKAW